MLNGASTVFITSPPPNVTSYDVFLTTAGDVLIATGVSAPRTPVPGEPGDFTSHIDLTIVGGFGKYAEATGTMTFDGVSHTGTVPRTADIIYKGTVCGPNVEGGPNWACCCGTPFADRGCTRVRVPGCSVRACGIGCTADEMNVPPLAHQRETLVRS
ncbi:hypothetical protein LuPra_02107 [Luteitalea pratensis]|uniref:Uncharacterized protein n=1 Tax=Luteitalea pratensis TaxID=1855912 RepID=A0A143PK88_LUTPR|nr:hypothetical protein LuPra_02107 [Luteitalea pratensis]